MKKFDADDDHEKKYNPNIILKHRMPALALCCLVRRPVGLKFKEHHLNMSLVTFYPLCPRWSVSAHRMYAASLQRRVLS